MESYFSQSKFVKELTPDDFDKFSPWKLSNEGNALILFYAPWCPHCKMMKDDWEKAAERIGFYDLYAFNCEENKFHLQKINEEIPHLINGYPTVISYYKGIPEEDCNVRKTDDIIKKAKEICLQKGKCK